VGAEAEAALEVAVEVDVGVVEAKPAVVEAEAGVL
jgi:hypothetical protein